MINFPKMPSFPGALSLGNEKQRIKQILATRVPHPQFWVGYFTPYISPINLETSKPYTKQDWEYLYNTVGNILELADSQIIRQDNVYEIFLVCLKNEADHPSYLLYQGINILKLIKGIESMANEVAMDNEILRAKYFSSELKQPGDMSLDRIKKSKVISLRDIYPQNYPKIEQKQENLIGDIKKLQPLFKRISSEKREQTFEDEQIGLQCPICLQQITLKTVCPITCGHNLHKSCLVQHFKSKVQIKSFPVLCPLGDCGNQLHVKDVQQYIPKQLLDKFYDFSMHVFVDKNKKNTSWCPTAGCTAAFQYEPGLKSYDCIGCKKSYCIDCQTQSHPSMTCDMNKAMKNMEPEEQEFVKFAEGAKMKQCPSCKFWVEKNRGCDHMTCRCLYEFCFRCGAQFGEGLCNCDQNSSFYGSQDVEEQRDEEEAQDHWADDQSGSLHDEEDHEMEIQSVLREKSSQG